MSHGTVLVVEDDDAIRRLLTDCLRGRSLVGIDTARDGVEALHRIRMQRYSVVLLDLLMPHMSGIDVLDSLRAMELEALPVPRIIVITGAAEEEIGDGDISRRCPTAVVSVFRKPIDLPRLVRSVEGVLEAVGSRE
jgi:CheY-like chemotaxis protein